jgi:hypothetical protein
MPTEEQMTVNERRKYLKLMKPRYQQAQRAERTGRLDRNGTGDRFASEEPVAVVACQQSEP